MTNTTTTITHPTAPAPTRSPRPSVRRPYRLVLSGALALGVAAGAAALATDDGTQRATTVPAVAAERSAPMSADAYERWAAAEAQATQRYAAAQLELSRRTSACRSGVPTVAPDALERCIFGPDRSSDDQLRLHGVR